MYMMYIISYCISSCFVYRPFIYHSTRRSISLRIPARATPTWPQILAIFSRSSKGAKALRESKHNKGQKSPQSLSVKLSVGYLQLNPRRDTGSACAHILILSASPNSVFPRMISVQQITGLYRSTTPVGCLLNKLICAVPCIEVRSKELHCIKVSVPNLGTYQRHSPKFPPARPALVCEVVIHGAVAASSKGIWVPSAPRLFVGIFPPSGC